MSRIFDESLSPLLDEMRLDVDEAECVCPCDSFESPSDSGENERSRLCGRVVLVGSDRESNASIQKLDEPVFGLCVVGGDGD